MPKRPLLIGASMTRFAGGEPIGQLNYEQPLKK
jgi:hypothetical protein